MICCFEREWERWESEAGEKEAGLMVANGVLGLIVLNIGDLNKIGVLGSILLGEGKCSSSGSCWARWTNCFIIIMVNDV